MDNAFGPESLAKAVHDLPELPLEEARVGVVAQNGEVGVSGSAQHEFGRGVFVAGEGSWFTRTGWKAAAMLGWKKK